MSIIQRPDCSVFDHQSRAWDTISELLNSGVSFGKTRVLLHQGGLRDVQLPAAGKKAFKEAAKIVIGPAHSGYITLNYSDATLQQIEKLKG